MNTMKLERQFRRSCILLFVPLLTLNALTPNDSEMRPSQSLPLAVASEVEIRDSDRGLRVAKLFGVAKPVGTIDLEKPRDLVAIYSEDPGLRRYVGYHFDEMANDKEFTGDTWYSSREIEGFRLLIMKFDSEGICERKEVVVDAASIVIWKKGE
jgi:hypothetical protein